MLKGVRVAIKYFTIGLLAGLLLAPRKGDETRSLLMDRARDYIQELMGVAQDAASKVQDQAGDLARDTHDTAQRGYESMTTDGVQ